VQIYKLFLFLQQLQFAVILMLYHFEIAELLNADFRPADWDRWSHPEGTGSALFIFNLALRFPCVRDGIKFLDADMR
jgi:hypothetical protein